MTLRLSFFKWPPLWMMLGLGLSLSSFLLWILALPPFRFGFWYQAELLNIALWSLGILASLWLIWMYRIKKSLVLYAFQIPIVWIFVLFGCLTFCFSILHALPLLDWTGNAQLGEGAFSFFAQAFLAAVLVITSRFPPIRLILIYATCVIGAIISTFTFIGALGTPFPSMLGWKWTPYYFPDYLAFISLAMGVMVSCLWASKQSKRRIVLTIALGTLTALSAYFSDNKALWGAVVISLACVMFIKCFLDFNARRFLSITAILLTLSFPIALSLTTLFSTFIPPTIVSRGNLLLFTFKHFFTDFNLQDIYMSLVGKGWGTYSDFVASNLFLSKDMDLFKANEGVPFQEAIARDFFHSHNILIEYFCAMGIIGVVALLLALYYLIQGLKRSYLYSGGFYICAFLLVSSFWFQMVATLPYTLFAFVLLSRRYPCPLTYLNKPAFIKSLCIAAPLLMIAMLPPYSLMSYRLGKESTLNRGENYPAKADKIATDPFIALDSYLGSQRLAPLIRSHTFAVIAFANNQKPPITPQDAFEGNYKLARFLFNHNPSCGSLYAYMAPLNILGELSASAATQKIFDRHPEAMQLWEKMTVDFLHCAPRRADMTIPYLSHLISHGKTEQAQSIIHIILQNNPNDPVGLWFSGILKLNAPGREQEGLYDLKQSVENGINRFIPMQEEMLRKLQSYGG